MGLQLAVGDLLFDMDKANKTEPKAPKAAPYRTGDATADGEVKMIGAPEDVLPVYEEFMS